MTRLGREPTTYRVRGGHANHEATPFVNLCSFEGLRYFLLQYFM